MTREELKKIQTAKQQVLNGQMTIWNTRWWKRATSVARWTSWYPRWKTRLTIVDAMSSAGQCRVA